MVLRVVRGFETANFRASPGTYWDLCPCVPGSHKMSPMHTQKQRQRQRQTQIDRQTDRQTDRQQTHTRTHTCTHTHAHARAIILHCKDKSGWVFFKVSLWTPSPEGWTPLVEVLGPPLVLPRSHSFCSTLDTPAVNWNRNITAIVSFRPAARHPSHCTPLLTINMSLPGSDSRCTHIIGNFSCKTASKRVTGDVAFHA